MEVSTGIYVSNYVTGMSNGAYIKRLMKSDTAAPNISTNELIVRDFIKQPFGTTLTHAESRIIYDTDYTYYMYNEKDLKKMNEPDEIIPPNKCPPLMKEEYPPLPYDDDSEISDNEEEETSTPPPEEETSTPPPEEETITTDNQQQKEEVTCPSDEDAVLVNKPAAPVLVGEIVNPLAENSAKCCIIV